MFYVYIYLDPLYKESVSYGDLRFDYVPLYVGKGKGGRFKGHLYTTNNPIFKNKIAYWKRNKIEPIVIKLHENLTEIEAWAYETQYIALIGRLDLGLGPLLNLTDGGEGPAGRVPWNKGRKTGIPLTPEQKAMVSAANKGKVVSLETRAKISAAHKNKPKSLEHKEKISRTRKGKSYHPNKGQTNVHPPERLEQWSKKHKEYWTDEKRQEASERNRGKKLSPEVKQKIVESRKLLDYTHSEETRQLMSLKRKEYWNKKKNESE